MRLYLNKTTRALIKIMIALVLISVIIAVIYYRNTNKAMDFRVLKAREMYTRYDSYAQEGNYYKVLSLLDSIESIYNENMHYASSFELGVLYNNRAAVFLTISMFADSIQPENNPFFTFDIDSLLILAEKNVLKAINIYESWGVRFTGKSNEEILDIIEPSFNDGLVSLDPELKSKYLRRRVNEIEDAVIENDRRLSVCFTNLGLVCRLRGDNFEAVSQYKKALDLWDRNLSAENNINILLGRPVRKRNIIQKLFPPDRDW